MEPILLGMYTFSHNNLNMYIIYSTGQLFCSLIFANINRPLIVLYKFLPHCFFFILLSIMVVDGPYYGLIEDKKKLNVTAGILMDVN